MREGRAVGEGGQSLSLEGRAVAGREGSLGGRAVTESGGEGSRGEGSRGKGGQSREGRAVAGREGSSGKGGQ